MEELSNYQRKYFGLEPVKDSWERVTLKGDKYRPDSFLYFDKDAIVKHIISIEGKYTETQYYEKTENRKFILPKTKRGKPKKLTAAVLDTKTPIGVYFIAHSDGEIGIGNHTTSTTFYYSNWHQIVLGEKIDDLISNFISNVPENHLSEITVFKNLKRKNIKYKQGDFFAFKLNLHEYGFGRILFDIAKAKKNNLIDRENGLNLIMAVPLMIKFYAYKSKSKNINIEILKSCKSLPADYIMDNVLFYGEYEIIGNSPLEINDFDFPISYGAKLDNTPYVFLQWGLIHLEISKKIFKKYISVTTKKSNEGYYDTMRSNPYGYYGVGLNSIFNSKNIIDSIDNDGNFDFEKTDVYINNFDLRNPKNKLIKNEIFKVFDLDPQKSYEENSKLVNAADIMDLINKM